MYSKNNNNNCMQGLTLRCVCDFFFLLFFSKLTSYSCLLLKEFKPFPPTPAETLDILPAPTLFIFACNYARMKVVGSISQNISN